MLNREYGSLIPYKEGDNMAKFALTLVIIGALNWLLVGLFEWDLVSALLGEIPIGNLRG